MSTACLYVLTACLVAGLHVLPAAAGAAGGGLLRGVPAAGRGHREVPRGRQEGHAADDRQVPEERQLCQGK